MTVVTLNKKELEKSIGKITKEVEDKIVMFGTTVEENTNDNFAIEVYPNRPDLLSMQGFVRAMESYLLGKKIKEYKIEKSNTKIIVDKSVAEVRPYCMAAIVKGIKFTDEKIKEIMQWQEKLHLTVGRNRKKVALGYYDLNKIKFPVKYLTKDPKEIVFEPLDMTGELNALQILSRHPCGREYGKQLDGFKKFPVYYDSDNQVLSMPPIINSNKSGKITQTTTDILVECSGTNLEALKKVIITAVTDLIDCGGKAYSVEIEYPDKKESISLDPEKLEIKLENINKTLGINLKEEEIPKLLEKMGIGYEKGYALIPAYRTDILHEADIVEEIAISYGYQNFKPEIPKISTVAEENKISILKRKLSSILTGLGLLETSSFHLTTKETIKDIYFEFKNFIEVEESKTEYNALRIDILTNLMKILSENSDSSYPQKIFEIGKTFSLDEKAETGIHEEEKLAITLTNEDSNFTTIKQALDYLFKMLNKEYKLEQTEHPAFITGRVGKIIVDNQEIGFIGEIAPRVLKNFKLKMPVCALEINIKSLN